MSNVDLYKHQWHVVRACSILRDEGFKIKLTLVGGSSGLGKQKLESELRMSDPNKALVSVINFVNANKLPAILKASDILVFASSCENMPNTLIEGMASGKPIACSSRGPMPEVLRDAGLYFDPEDHKTIAAAIRKLLVDPKLKYNLSNKAYDRSMDFSWDKCARETITFIKEVYNAYEKREN